VRRSYSVIGLSVLALLSFASFAFSQQGSLSKSSLTFAPQLAGSVSAPPDCESDEFGNCCTPRDFGRGERGLLRQQ
jgi:hypothetical protein